MGIELNVYAPFTKFHRQMRNHKKKYKTHAKININFKINFPSHTSTANTESAKSNQERKKKTIMVSKWNSLTTFEMKFRCSARRALYWVSGVRLIVLDWSSPPRFTTKFILLFSRYLYVYVMCRVSSISEHLLDKFASYEHENTSQCMNYLCETYPKTVCARARARQRLTSTYVSEPLTVAHTTAVVAKIVNRQFFFFLSSSSGSSYRKV